ncbi:MAG TPA: hypothetical protein VM368_05935, partial [Flavisolibacter sp.]|nr:hypothetical protein [Flavisolibacter sp.]
MQRLIRRIFTLSFLLVGTVAYSQDPVTSVDPNLLALQNARVPKEFTIRSIKVTGVATLDTAIVTSISGLQVGDKVMIPGGDAFSKAINNLWRQRLFSNAQVFILATDGDFIDLEINVQERPRLGNFSFVGPKKSEAEELQGKIGLAKSTIITENTKRNAI